MEGNLNAFREIGLPKTEARILNSLIIDGPATGSTLAMRIGIQKSVVYFALTQIMHRGLVYFVVVNGKKEYRIVEANIMKTIIENRNKEFSKNIQQITQILETIPKSKKHAELKIFQDWSGMKKAFEELLEVKQGIEGIVFPVSIPEKVLSRFRRLMKQVHSKRVNKKIPCKLLISSKLYSTIGKDRKKEPFTTVRFVYLEQLMPMIVNVYGDKTLLAVWTSPPSAIIIPSKDVADSFRVYFNLMWKSGKE